MSYFSAKRARFQILITELVYFQYLLYDNSAKNGIIFLSTTIRIIRSPPHISHVFVRYRICEWYCPGLCLWGISGSFISVFVLVTRHKRLILFSIDFRLTQAKTCFRHWNRNPEIIIVEWVNVKQKLHQANKRSTKDINSNALVKSQRMSIEFTVALQILQNWMSPTHLMSLNLHRNEWVSPVGCSPPGIQTKLVLICLEVY